MGKMRLTESALHLVQSEHSDSDIRVWAEVHQVLTRTYHVSVINIIIYIYFFFLIVRTQDTLLNDGLVLVSTPFPLTQLPCRMAEIFAVARLLDVQGGKCAREERDIAWH